MQKVYELYIRTTPQRLWEAITDPALRARYNFGAAVVSDWTPGSRYEMTARGGSVRLGEGEILEVDAPRRLVQSLVALWSEDVKREGTSRITWDIEPIADDSCRLTLTHDQLRDGAHDELYGGWPMILSGLKTLLETGGTLTTPGSLRYAEGAQEAPADLPSAAPGRKLFVNLAVRDIHRSVAFFTALGFGFDARFTDETATCMLLGDDAFVMLIQQERFGEFTQKQICDTSTHTEGLFAWSCASREEVDRIVETALAAGAKNAMDPQDHGFMYGWSFYDLDGHHWEPFWMDPNAQ